MERALPCQQLVEDDAEGPDIGAPIDGLSSRLLGTHVGGGSEDQAHRRRGTRHRRRMRKVGGADGALWTKSLRKPEVENFDRAVRTQLDVLRLQIAMNDARLVRGLECRRDLTGDRERLVNGDPPTGN